MDRAYYLLTWRPESAPPAAVSTCLAPPWTPGLLGIHSSQFWAAGSAVTELPVLLHNFPATCSRQMTLLQTTPPTRRKFFQPHPPAAPHPHAGLFGTSTSRAAPYPHPSRRRISGLRPAACPHLCPLAPPTPSPRAPSSCFLRGEKSLFRSLRGTPLSLWQELGTAYIPQQEVSTPDHRARKEWALTHNTRD